MVVNGIYLGKNMVYRVYHRGEIIFLRDPIVFHVIEDGKLIILGAYSAKSYPDGMYLDCEPEESEEPGGEWEYPVQDGYVLKITQVYSATQNGNVLEVE